MCCSFFTANPHVAACFSDCQGGDQGQGTVLLVDSHMASILAVSWADSHEAWRVTTVVCLLPEVFCSHDDLHLVAGCSGVLQVDAPALGCEGVVQRLGEAVGKTIASRS